MILPPVQDVPTDKAHIDPDNLRTVYRLEDLTGSIRTYGMLQPIGLWDAGERGYFAIWGNRRLLAAKELQLPVVPARVFAGPMPPGDADLLQLIENLNRADLLPSEEAAGYRQTMERRCISSSELAALLERSPGTITKKLALLKLAPPLLAMIDQRRLAETAGYELSHLEHAVQLELMETFPDAGRIGRDEAVKAARARMAQAKPSAAKKVALKLRGGMSVTLSDDEQALERLVSELSELLRLARKAREENHDLRALSKSLRARQPA